MMRLAIAALSAILVLWSAPADAWVSKKKYQQWLQSLPAEGPPPTEEYAREFAMEFLRTNLKDSESARYEWGSIELGTWRGTSERFGTPGWILSAEVNAKNSYGGYTGFTPYKFVFRSGWLVEAYMYHARLEAWIGLLGMGNELPSLPSYQGESLPTEAPPPPGQMQYRPKFP